MLDAGSSHTEVALYKWLGDQVQNTGIVYEVTSCETHNGIDDFEEKIAATLADLMPCVRNVTGSIDFDKQGATPVYLGATAGMRLLKMQKPVVAQHIFSAIESELRSYRDDDKSLSVRQVRVLTGAEEGLFAWIATNFLLNNFPRSTEEASAAPRQTAGELQKTDVAPHARRVIASCALLAHAPLI